jgi:hypothetical protein
MRQPIMHRETSTIPGYGVNRDDHRLGEIAVGKRYIIPTYFQSYGNTKELKHNVTCTYINSHGVFWFFDKARNRTISYRWTEVLQFLSNGKMREVYY